MFLPQATATDQSRDMIQQFYGYNHNLRVSDGEFYDEENMSSDLFPVLAPRAKRASYDYGSGISGDHYTTAIIPKDSLYYIDNNKLYNAEGNTLVWDFSGLTTIPIDIPRRTVSMGAYIIIFPDKLYFNTVDSTDKGMLEYTDETPSAEGATGDITFTLSDEEGTDYVIAQDAVRENAPTNPANRDLWLQVDINSVPQALRIYSDATKQWAFVDPVYVKISAPGIAANVRESDTPTFEMFTKLPSETSWSKITQGNYIDGQFASNNLLYTHNVIYKVHKHDAEVSGDPEDYVLVQGLCRPFTRHLYDPDTGRLYKLAAKNLIPNMDFVVESNNRLWGCRYGDSVDGKFVNEIYASKLGDFRSWYCFQSIKSDSYAASCGTDGHFTGAISYLGYPLFFKETVLHKVYGQDPSNYQIQSIACRGVERGAGASLAIIEERLFYKSKAGVCVYDGSLPALISSPLGLVLYNGQDAPDAYYGSLYTGAVAGATNNKYYISMKSDEDGKRHLFVYDAALNVWHREDNLHCDAIGSYKNVLYYIDHENKKLHYYGGTDEIVKWSFETGDLGLSSPDKKYVSKIVARLELSPGATVSFYIQYDKKGQFTHLSTIYGDALKTFNIPIKPRRCDHFRLRITGEGDVKLYSLAKSIRGGSSR